MTNPANIEHRIAKKYVCREIPTPLAWSLTGAVIHLGTLSASGVACVAFSAAWLAYMLAVRL
jgi:hypothetical protein